MLFSKAIVKKKMLNHQRGHAQIPSGVKYYARQRLIHCWDQNKWNELDLKAWLKVNWNQDTSMLSNYFMLIWLKKLFYQEINLFLKYDKCVLE